MVTMKLRRRLHAIFFVIFWLVKYSLSRKRVRGHTGGCFIFRKACPLFGVTPLRDLPPHTPLQCPHPDKKGTNLLLFKFYIHLHTYEDLRLTCCRVMGQKLRYGRPNTHDLPGTHNWLAQPHVASFVQNSTDLTHIYTNR